jgi:hypothetical protein
LGWGWEGRSDVVAAVSLMLSVIMVVCVDRSLHFNGKASRRAWQAACRTFYVVLWWLQVELISNARFNKRLTEIWRLDTDDALNRAVRTSDGILAASISLNVINDNPHISHFTISA